MPERKRFLLRLDPRLYAALERWAADDLRSVNSQIEYLLAEAAKRSGRLTAGGAKGGQEPDPAAAPNPDA